MPTVETSSSIDVRGTAEAAFRVVESDLLVIVDDPRSMGKQRPLASGPLRAGFRWEQTVIHERRLCRSEWLITKFERARILEQELHHVCAVRDVEVTGRERWEFDTIDPALTVVTLRSWRTVRGLGAWLSRIGWKVVDDFAVRRRLLAVQYRAELPPTA